VKALVIVALAAGLCSCNSEPSQSKLDGEQAAVRFCQQEFATRTGSTSTRAMPWRTISKRSGSSTIVNIWTHTPVSAARPTGKPDYVCRK
jgi:hypothetical protein